MLSLMIDKSGPVMENVDIPAGTHNDLDDLALTVCRPMLKRPPWEDM